MSFKNPWGAGNPNFDRWFKNEWSENGRHFEASQKKLSAVQREFQLPLVTYNSRFRPPSGDPDSESFIAELSLLQAANEVIPFAVKECLDVALTKLQATEFSVAVFDQFDYEIKECFGSNQSSVVGWDENHADHRVIGYDFIASLLSGTTTSITVDKRTGKTNLIKRNYEVVKKPVFDFLGSSLEQSQVVEVPLYQPALFPEGPLLRLGSFLETGLFLNDQTISVTFTVGEISLEE